MGAWVRGRMPGCVCVCVRARPGQGLACVAGAQARANPALALANERLALSFFLFRLVHSCGCPKQVLDMTPYHSKKRNVHSN